MAGPKEMLSTKWPSMMSQWIQSAPAASTFWISLANCEKSAASMDAAMARLKIFDFWSADIGAKDDVLEIFHDLEITELFKHDDIKPAIIDDGMLKKWKWTAVEPAVADEDKRAFGARGVFGLDRQFW